MALKFRDFCRSNGWKQSTVNWWHHCTDKTCHSPPNTHTHTHIVQTHSVKSAEPFIKRRVSNHVFAYQVFLYWLRVNNTYTHHFFCIQKFQFDLKWENMKFVYWWCCCCVSTAWTQIKVEMESNKEEWGETKTKQSTKHKHNLRCV